MCGCVGCVCVCVRTNWKIMKANAPLNTVSDNLLVFAHHGQMDEVRGWKVTWVAQSVGYTLDS